MKTAMLCLFHDTHEARINDLHRVAKRYIETGIGEREAFSEQVERLPEKIATEVASLISDYEGKESLESISLANQGCVLDILLSRSGGSLTRSGIMLVRLGGTVVLMGSTDMDLSIPYK